MSSNSRLAKLLRKSSCPLKSKSQASFFKTAPGQYGEGDKFLGISVPQLRELIKDFFDLELAEIKKLLMSEFHEERLAAVLILVKQFQNTQRQDEIFSFYIKNAKLINNWDLVDSSAHHIAGVYLFNKNKRSQLFRLAKSKNLWERRIAIVSTWYFIKAGKFQDTIEIAELLLNDREDLIHKAVGWMLREVGKKDKAILVCFLEEHASKMPRTMLRYAIEKFTVKEREYFLHL